MKKFLIIFFTIFFLQPTLVWADNKELLEQLDNKRIECVKATHEQKKKCDHSTDNQCENNIFDLQSPYQQCHKEIAVEILTKFYNKTEQEAKNFIETLQKQIYDEQYFIEYKSKYCKGYCADRPDTIVKSRVSSEIEEYVYNMIMYLYTKEVQKKIFSELKVEDYEIYKFRIYSKAIEKHKKLFISNFCKNTGDSKCFSQNTQNLATLKKYYFMHLSGIFAYYYQMDKEKAKEFTENMWNNVYQRNLFIFSDKDITDEAIFNASLISIIYLHLCIFDMQDNLHLQQFYL